jgi:DNA-directed RNA polymerase specialized sigma24 family protein
MSTAEEATPPLPQTAKTEPARTEQGRKLNHAFTLIPSAQAGNREALEQIADCLNPYCHKLATRLFHHKAPLKIRIAYDAEDIANEALATVIKNINTIDTSLGTASFLGYVAETVKRAFWNKNRSERAGSRGGENQATSIDNNFDVPDKSHVPIESDTFDAVVTAAQELLTPRQFATWKMVVDNPTMKLNDLAKSCGSTKQAFGVRFHKAQSHLSDCPRILEMLARDPGHSTQPGPLNAKQ